MLSSHLFLCLPCEYEDPLACQEPLASRNYQQPEIFPLKFYEERFSICTHDHTPTKHALYIKTTVAVSKFSCVILVNYILQLEFSCPHTTESFCWSGGECFSWDCKTSCEMHRPWLDIFCFLLCCLFSIQHAQDAGGFVFFFAVFLGYSLFFSFLQRQLLHIYVIYVEQMTFAAKRHNAKKYAS